MSPAVHQLPGAPDREDAALVAAALEPNEEVAWLGRARPDGLARRVRGISAFGFLFAGFAAAWMLAAAGVASFMPVRMGPGPDAPPAPLWLLVVFPLWGVPFLAIGLWLASAGRQEAQRADRVVYAVTDRRVLVVQGYGAGESLVQSVPPQDLGMPTKFRRADGSGDLVFCPPGISVLPRQRRRRMRGVPPHFDGLWGVEDVDDVYRLLVALWRSREPEFGNGAQP